MTISGDDLISWGVNPGRSFKGLLDEAKRMELVGEDRESIVRATLSAHEAMLAEARAREDSLLSLRTNSIPFPVFLDPESDDERSNLEAVVRHVDAIVRLPTVARAAVMPDAMPSGSELGTIPVGGVVETEDTIHPGFHSADICCSLAITVLKRDEDVRRILDEAMKVTHFGLGKRPKSEVREHRELKDIMRMFEGNRFLDNPKVYDAAENHFMTQGDGNHFLFVGQLQSNGQMAIVTHHGSRSLGAMLYKFGMAAARKHTAIVAPRVPSHQAWLDYDSEQGQHYWRALEVIRLWTKANHFAIHDGIARRLGVKVEDRFWNEHNHCFIRNDRIVHAKGATPSYSGFSQDDDGRTLIPMNMAQPILIANHTDQDSSLAFAPHGAGRNFSRTEHGRRLAAEFGVSEQFKETKELPPEVVAEVMRREVDGLDVRFYTGKPDLSELPSSYKSAEQVERQIGKHNLAYVIDRVIPRGCIMAGEVDQPWRRR